MTGAEFTGAAQAAKAVADVGQKALEQPDAVEQVLLEKANDSTAMAVAADTYARRVAVKEAIILRLYQPLARMFGVSSAYFDQDFAGELAEKVATIPEESLTSPKPSVAVPAMQGLALSLDEADLKEMYLNLLATASDGRRAEDAHPSFAQIIQELSASEVHLLNVVLDAKRLALVQFRRVTTSGEHPGFHVLCSHVLNLRDTVTGAPVGNSLVASYVDNWSRLGLVTATYSDAFVDDAMYEWANSRPEAERFRAEECGEGARIEPQKGILTVTDFGLRFATAVQPPQLPPLAEDGPDAGA